MTSDNTKSSPAPDNSAEGPDAKGATEEDMQRIEVIEGSEVLGYEGAGREEHSGQNEPVEPVREQDKLADNLPKDLPSKAEQKTKR